MQDTIPPLHPRTGAARRRLDRSAADALATCVANRDEAGGPAPAPRPLDDVESDAMRTLGRLARDPDALERLAYLQCAVGLAVGWDADLADGLRLATRAALADRVATETTTSTEIVRHRRLLDRHRDRDPRFVRALLSGVDVQGRTP